jgi:hypothetical protein
MGVVASCFYGKVRDAFSKASDKESPEIKEAKGQLECQGV